MIPADPIPRPCGACAVLLRRPDESCEHWPKRTLTPEQVAAARERKRAKEARQRQREKDKQAIAKFGEILNG